MIEDLLEFFLGESPAKTNRRLLEYHYGKFCEGFADGVDNARNTEVVTLSQKTIDMMVRSIQFCFYPFGGVE